MSARAVAGFVLLPFFAAALGAIALPLAWRLTSPANSLLSDPGQVAVAGAALCGALGAVVTVVAVPVVAWLRRRERLALRHYVWTGIALGNAPFAIWIVALVIPATIAHALGGTLSDHLLPLSELIWGSIRVLTLGTSLGAALGAAFWVIAIRGGAHSAERR